MKNLDYEPELSNPFNKSLKNIKHYTLGILPLTFSIIPSILYKKLSD